MPPEDHLDVARSARSFELLTVAMLALAAGLIAWIGRHWFFLHDEWGFIFYRRSGGPSAFFAAFHGHLFAVVIAIYRALFATVGLRDYTAYRAVEIALHVICSGLVYLYARNRGVSRVFALLTSAVLAFLGPAWEVLLWLASAGFIIPVIMMIGTLLVWDRMSRGSNALTALLAVGALGTHSVGVAVVIGLIVASFSQGPRIRRLLALGVPLLGWAVWFAAVRPKLSTPASLRHVAGASKSGDVGMLGHLANHVSQLPSWFVNSAAGSFAAVIGRPGWTGLGLILLVALIAGAGWTWYRRTLDRWRFCGIAASLIAFWVFTDIGRAQGSSPIASRYLYPAVALILLLAVECLRQVRLPASATTAVVVVMALSVWLHVDVLQNEANNTARSFAHEKIVLSRLESCEGKLDPKFVAVQGVPAGPFWAATKALGQPVPAAPKAGNPLCP